MKALWMVAGVVVGMVLALPSTAAAPELEPINHHYGKAYEAGWADCLDPDFHPRRWEK